MLTKETFFDSICINEGGTINLLNTKTKIVRLDICTQMRGPLKKFWYFYFCKQKYNKIVIDPNLNFNYSNYYKLKCEFG